MASGFAAYTPQGSGSGGGGGGNASVGTTGIAAPASATEVGFVDGSGNLQPFSGTNAASGPNVAVTSSALPTGAATASLQTTGNSVLGSILSDLTNGTQITQIGGTVPLATGAATSANQTTEITALQAIQANQGPQTTALSAIVTNTSTAIPDLTTSGNITTQNLNPNSGTATAGSSVAITLNGQNTVAMQVTGTYTGTLTFQVSIDGINWVGVFGTTTNSLISSGSTASGQNAMWAANVAGYNMFRLSATSGAVTGTAVVSLRASVATTGQSTVVLGAGSSNIGATTFTYNGIATDVVSSAIITTTTTGTLSPTTGVTYNASISVSAVSGTTPTMLVTIQESTDGGGTWYSVYTFPSITTTGFFVSPILLATGNKIRYVQIIGGSSPSFSRSIIRTVSNSSTAPYYKNLIDTAIVTTSSNSSTASVFVENLNTYTAIVNQGTGGSAVTFALDGSDDNVNWVQNLTQCVGVVGGATPVTMSYSAAAYRYVRVRVVLGVAATTISYVSIVGSIGAGTGVIRPTYVTFTDRSGSTSGTPSTSTTLAAANPTRRYFHVDNLTTNTATIWINFTSAATAGSGSISILPGGSFTMENSSVTTEAITVLSATASIPFTAKEA